MSAFECDGRCDRNWLAERKEKLEREIRNLTSAIGESGHSKYILEEIAIREKKISAITDRLLSAASDSIQTRIEEIATFVSEGIEKLCEALNKSSPLAKQKLHSHLSAIRMFPTQDGEGWYYIAEGTWDLLGTHPFAPIFGVPADGRIRLVAGARYVPNTQFLCLRFRSKLIHSSV